MKLLKTRLPVEVPAGSMADIAFLLLAFFMMTTTVVNEKGITIMLPPVMISEPQPIHDRNLFTIKINSFDQLMVEGERRETVTGLRDELKKFIMNMGSDSNLSLSPEKAIVSFKTDRGTSYKAYITALDEIQAAYYELYAQQAGITAEQFRKLELSNAADKLLYDKGRKGIPMNISIAD
jgi:biopolymer transport protein ExbD